MRSFTSRHIFFCSTCFCLQRRKQAFLFIDKLQAALSCTFLFVSVGSVATHTTTFLTGNISPRALCVIRLINLPVCYLQTVKGRSLPCLHYELPSPFSVIGKKGGSTIPQGCVRNGRVVSRISKM